MEVEEALSRAHGSAGRQLGPYARVVGAQAADVDAGEVLLDLEDGGAHALGAGRQVVGRVDPLDVGAEAQPARKVEGQVRPQASRAGLRGRVDEAGYFRVRGRVGEVAALGVVQLPTLRGVRDDHVVHIDGAQARGVDDGLGGDDARLPRARVLDRDLPPRRAFLLLRVRSAAATAQWHDGPDGGILRHHAALVLEETPQGHHEPVRVDDARRRALQARRLGPDVPAPLPLQLRLAHPPHRHADLLVAEPAHVLERLGLRGRLRDYPLARPAVRHPPAGAEVVQHAPPPGAEVRLERPRAVVYPRVHDLAVARRRLHADLRVALEEER